MKTYIHIHIAGKRTHFHGCVPLPLQLVSVSGWCTCQLHPLVFNYTQTQTHHKVANCIHTSKEMQIFQIFKQTEQEVTTDCFLSRAHHNCWALGSIYWVSQARMQYRTHCSVALPSCDLQTLPAISIVSDPESCWIFKIVSDTGTLCCIVHGRWKSVQTVMFHFVVLTALYLKTVATESWTHRQNDKILREEQEETVVIALRIKYRWSTASRSEGKWVEDFMWTHKHQA